MKLKKIIASFLATISIATPVIAETNDELMYLDAIINYASTLYIDSSIYSDDMMRAAVAAAVKENPEIMYKMIKAAFGELDEYSEFYTAEEYQKYYEMLTNSFYGMGAIIQLREDEIFIVRLIDGGGAQLAGLKAGDVITAVDGVDVAGKSLDEVTQMARGEKGTTLVVNVRRGTEILEYTVERLEVSGTTVGYRVLPSDIAYVEITNFSDDTPKEFENVLRELDNEGITKIVLDLRSNPGGMLTSVVDIARMIVPEGVILQTIYRNEVKNMDFYSYNKNPKYKFSVLVNGDTASAAEVLTGALQDSGIGYVVGETTFGKGLIQDVFVLPSGDAFKITTGHYLTRNGKDINKVGIYPDEVVKNGTGRIDISKYEAFDYKHKWKIGESGKGVLAAKQRLSIMGYYSGVIDEHFDKALEVAVYNFQKNSKLYPYGVLDFSTQATLENAFYALDVVIDDQLYAAYEHLGGNWEDLE
ncbi:MAG: PDZ domain-containing protein [Eubacteriales bacterium]|nr:PDZ domain-containing protein [Eubacteriales bacterium]